MPEPEVIELSVSEFVALFNQTLEFAYPSITITGELANFRVSKNRWVYFDLKDELSTVKFFGTVYQLPGPLEDGMILRVRGQPKLHNLYGFSVNVMAMQPAGEGSIRKAQNLLQAKLQKEGLFDPARKRPLPYPPEKIGLIASKQSAAYADFVKVLAARWGGMAIELIDVQVQGESAPRQIVGALEQFNSIADTPEVLVLARGGGSPEDLSAFSTEQVARAVAASRVPTLVAVGHETDLSLAELAADQRASTPSNAAELLVPDRKHAQRELADCLKRIGQATGSQIKTGRVELAQIQANLAQLTRHHLEATGSEIRGIRQLLAALNPAGVLDRGYAIVRQQGKIVQNASELGPNDIVETQLSKGTFTAKISEIRVEKS